MQKRWQEGLEDQLLSDWLPVMDLVCDAHPGYVSHQRLRSLAHRLPLSTVPHHLAHGLAVGAEHGLRPPFLALACDGLGLADPGRPDGEERLWGWRAAVGEGLSRRGAWTGRGWRPCGLSLPGGERAGVSRAAVPWACWRPPGPGPWPIPGRLHAGGLLLQERSLLLQGLAQGESGPAHQFPGPSAGWAGVPAAAGPDPQLRRRRGPALAGGCGTGRKLEARGASPELWPFPLESASPGILSPFLWAVGIGSPCSRSCWQIGPPMAIPPGRHGSWSGRS